MPVFRRQRRARGGAFEFRVSDVVAVPLRGTMLRLRLVEGSPSLEDLAVGRELVLRGPAGAERRVRIRAHSVTIGKPAQARLDRTGELDVIIEDDSGGEPIEIGWLAGGPLS
jgi:hypothetical protein